jgi:hypothetical protein
VHVPDALIPKQVAALVQAADPKNRKLVLSAAMRIPSGAAQFEFLAVPLNLFGQTSRFPIRI